MLLLFQLLKLRIYSALVHLHQIVLAGTESSLADSRAMANPSNSFGGCCLLLCFCFHRTLNLCTLHVFVSVMHLWVFVHVCAHGCRDKRSTSLQEPFLKHFVFKRQDFSLSWASLVLSEQWVPGICLSLLPLCWIYKQVPPCLVLFHGFWWLNSGFDVCIASILSTEPSLQFLVYKAQ